MKSRQSTLAINLSIVNMDEVSLDQGHLETTFRHEGLSIGQDYLRLEGSTISRGELQPATLNLEHTLGRGNCSRVIKATWTKKNGMHQPVALKQFPLHSDEQKNMLAKELNTLGKVDCECLVKLLGAFLEGNSVTIVSILTFIEQLKTSCQ
jgi:Protein tyrosine and serine/threonine kinase